VYSEDVSARSLHPLECKAIGPKVLVSISIQLLFPVTLFTVSPLYTPLLVMDPSNTGQNMFDITILLFGISLHNLAENRLHTTCNCGVQSSQALTTVDSEGVIHF